jgi:hypothetical protein
MHPEFRSRWSILLTSEVKREIGAKSHQLCITLGMFCQKNTRFTQRSLRFKQGRCENHTRPDGSQRSNPCQNRSGAGLGTTCRG